MNGITPQREARDTTQWSLYRSGNRIASPCSQELRSLCLFLPSHRPSERKLTHPKANQREACNLDALLGMAPEVAQVNCGVSAAPKQKEQQPDFVLARDSNHSTSVLRTVFEQA